MTKRPAAIVWFGRFYLLSVVLSLIVNGAIRSVYLSNPFFVLEVLISPVLALSLWYFVTYRRSSTAKWVLVTMAGVTVALDVLGPFLLLPMALPERDMIVSFGLAGLEIIAVAMLFMPDARPWFDGSHDDNLAETFS